jgi:hypothetical protein
MFIPGHSEADGPYRNRSRTSHGLDHPAATWTPN